MIYYCYLLECNDGSIYCGITNNLQKRVLKHSRGEASKYTRSRLPCVLVYCEACDNKSSALKRELEIKKMPRNEKLKLISKNDSERGNYNHATHEHRDPQ